jgi:HD-GYP domain-containing protein (c-di-GMP phosphodiesterase class II)
MIGRQKAPTSLISLALSVEARDPYTAGHTWRVSMYSVALARALHLGKREVHMLEIGAILHDLGKITIADGVLHKPGPLTEVESQMMQTHPQAGYRILQGDAFYHQHRSIVELHHERYDGKGYPSGLKGDNIPFEARVLAIADSFDAMTSNRPYRKAMDPSAALAELDRCRGTQFDPRLVDVFQEVWGSGTLEGVILHSSAGHPLQECPHHGAVIATNDVYQEIYGEGCSVCRLALNGLMRTT